MEESRPRVAARQAGGFYARQVARQGGFYAGQGCGALGIEASTLSAGWRGSDAGQGCGALGIEASTLGHQTRLGEPVLRVVGQTRT